MNHVKIIFKYIYLENLTTLSSDSDDKEKWHRSVLICDFITGKTEMWTEKGNKIHYT